MKNRTKPNELDETKYPKLLSQMTSCVHSHASLYWHAQICIRILIFIYRIQIQKQTERHELIEQNEQEYSKTPLQMSNNAHKHIHSQ